jgi:hypothetical protein
MNLCERCGQPRGHHKRFCSNDCRLAPGQPRIGMSPEAWSRVQDACRQARTGKLGVASHAWEGEEAGYGGVHQWIGKHWPKTGTCQSCGREGDKTQWANMDGKYNREDRSSWAELCPSCHKIRDSRPNGDTDETPRTCSRCHEIKPARLFVRCKSKPGGRACYCLSCSREISRARKTRLAS